MSAISMSACASCNKEFNIFEKGSVGSVYVKGLLKGSLMPEVKHFNFCKKCVKKIGLDKYSKR